MNTVIDVLVVDDDAELVTVILWMLEDLGLRGVHAANGRDGYEKAVELKPRLVLSDVMMPLMRGDELLMALQENPVTKDIPCILMTSAPGTVRDQLVELVPKPFDLSHLESLIKSHLDARQAG